MNLWIGFSGLDHGDFFFPENFWCMLLFVCDRSSRLGWQRFMIFARYREVNLVIWCLTQAYDGKCVHVSSGFCLSSGFTLVFRVVELLAKHSDL